MEIITKIKKELLQKSDARKINIKVAIKGLNSKTQDFHHYLSFLISEFDSFHDYLKLSLYDLLIKNNINPFINSNFKEWMIDKGFNEIIYSEIDNFKNDIEILHQKLPQHLSLQLHQAMEKIRLKLELK